VQDQWDASGIAYSNPLVSWTTALKSAKQKYQQRKGRGLLSNCQISVQQVSTCVQVLDKINVRCDVSVPPTSSSTRLKNTMRPSNTVQCERYPLINNGEVENVVQQNAHVSEAGSRLRVHHYLRLFTNLVKEPLQNARFCIFVCKGVAKHYDRLDPRAQTTHHVIGTL
jgi:hypothetical protein